MMNPYLLTLIAFVVTQAYAQVGDWIFGRVAMDKEAFQMLVEASWLKTASLVVVLVLFEELFFRLLLVGVLGLHVWQGFIPISVVLFSLLHLANVRGAHRARLRLFLLHLGSGSFLTYLFLAHGFFTVLLCHLLFNAVTLVTSRLHYRLRPHVYAQARARAYGEDRIATPAPAAVTSFDSWTIPPASADAGA